MGKNISPVKDTAEAQRRGRAGGIASGKARQKRKELRELLEVALSLPDEERGMSNAEAIAAALVEKAKAGDVRAFEIIRDSIGERPTDRVAVEEEQKLNVRVRFVRPDGRESDRLLPA